MTAFDDMLIERSVIVVVGSGGVGKTTNAAALGLRAAELGRRAVVVTVDPARRLADALGLSDGLSSDAQLIRADSAGETWASMLDPRTTFDRLIAEESRHADLTERIANNRIYDNLAGGLSGTQEYLAIEELFALHHDDRFDLVIVDTPPSRDVLDIVDAPTRLVTLFDNRIYQLLTGRNSGLAWIVGKTAQRFVRTVAAVVGAEVVEDAIEFFTMFESLEGGFRDRAVAVRELLISDATAVVLVAAPKPDVVITCLELTTALADRSLAPDAAIINLFHPDPSAAMGAVEREARIRGPVDDAVSRLARRADNEHLAMEPLLAALGPIPTIGVPSLADDIHDDEGLRHVVACLAEG